ncbi:MAG: hypothetical protein J5593_05765 [Bacteroidaceae bacterium]|nr:hypothetical protein [Bacteroidaceae bacterium]
MKGTHAYILLMVSAALMMVSCGKKPKGVDNPQPSVYYWRTTFSLDSLERSFLAEAEVGRMYVHFFDVVKGQGSGAESQEAGVDLMPANTLVFEDSVPQGIEVIPTVFFEPNVLRDTVGVHALAGLVLKRIDQMTKQNGLATAQQVQMDYDWVASDEAAYFAFLRELRDLLHRQGRTLSATIRLHQLAKAVPPVDEGVLMVYNVGNFRDEAEENSILTTKAVEPYLPRLESYDLPLCAALPVYGWDLLFQNHNFRQIVRGVDLSDTLKFRKMDSTHYRAEAYMAAPADGIADPAGQRIYPGDMIRHEQPSMGTLRQVRDMLERSRSGVCDQVVIYHLDSKFLKDNSYEIKEIF